MNKAALYLIKKYQKNKTIVGSGRCRYYPTCSNYALEAYQKFNFFYASLLTAWRILRCNPLAKRRFDPVPLSKAEKLLEKRLVALKASPLAELFEVITAYSHRHPYANYFDFYELISEHYFGPSPLGQGADELEKLFKDAAHPIALNPIERMVPIGNGLYRVPLNLIGPDLHLSLFLAALAKTKAAPLPYTFPQAIALLHELSDLKVLTLKIPEETNNLPEHMFLHKHNPPTYFLINQKNMDFRFYLSQIKKLIKPLENKKQIIITIDGVTASGRFALSRTLEKELGATIIPLIRLFNTNRSRVPKKQNLLKPPSINKFIHNLKQELTDSKTTQTNKIFIIEGALTHLPPFVPFYDISLYVETGQKTHLQHLENQVIPTGPEFTKKKQALLKFQHVKKFADLIIFGEF